MDSNLHIPIIFLIVTFIFYYILSGRKSRSGKQINYPPEPEGAVPILGHLPLIWKNDKPFHRFLADWSEKLGPVFNLRIGLGHAFVVNRMEEARECFTKNDKLLTSRPKVAAATYMAYEHATFGFAPSGDYWREMRKLTTQEVLTNQRVEVLQHVWKSEIGEAMRDIYSQCSRGSNNRTALVELKKWIVNLQQNIMIRTLVGKVHFTYAAPKEEVRLFQESFEAFGNLAGVIPLSDVVPYCEWLDHGGYIKKMKETGKEMDSVLSGWLDEHRRKKNSRPAIDEDRRDFMDALLSLQDQGHFSKFPYDADTCIKSTCLEVLVDGFETASVALIWAMMVLMVYPDVLAKAHEELDRVVGRDRLANESDLSQLTYIQSIFKETFRLYPPAPILAPREAVEDCTVGGYHIPKGSRVIINAWNIHMDPRSWTDVLEFRPERFLTESAAIDVRGQNYELIPFSAGRRSCPGATFALRLLYLEFAQLVQSFDFKVSSDHPIDMAELRDVALTKSSPLMVKLTPRLRDDLYA